MVEKPKTKPVYEKPVVVPLGELAKGEGAPCSSGSGANPCSNGGGVAKNCRSGSGDT
jgi:hypothetical protein